MRKLILCSIFCLLCSTVHAANDFSADANCVALWRFENGALTTDSKGTNTLTASASSPTADTVNYKDGAASADFETTNGQYFSLASPAAKFPFIAADTSKNFSMCCWVKPESFFASETIYSKTSAGTASAWIRFDVSGNLEFYLYTTTWELAEFSVSLATGKWYHITCTYQNSDKAYRVRIYDDTAAAQLDVDKTGNFANIVRVGSDVVYVGHTGSGTGYNFDGLIDEMVILNDVLTVDEIDEIRSGTYGPAAPPAGGGQVIIIEME